VKRKRKRNIKYFEGAGTAPESKNILSSSICLFAFPSRKESQNTVPSKQGATRETFFKSIF